LALRALRDDHDCLLPQLRELRPNFGSKGFDYALCIPASDNVTVIDGVTLSMTTVSAANALVPTAVAVDQTTNKVYVANLGAGAVCPAELMGECNPGSVTLIDGVTHATTLLIDAKARLLSEGPIGPGLRTNGSRLPRGHLSVRV